MANSGSYPIKVNGTGTQFGTLTWEVISQSADDLTSTVRFTITAGTTLPNISMRHEATGLVINGKTVHSREESFYVNTGSGTTGTTIFTYDYIATHNTDGSGKINKVLVTMFLAINGVEYPCQTSQSITLPILPLPASILTASNFTDEENPVITYKNPAGSAVTALEACISVTGGNDDVAYRSISKTGTKYTFNLTAAERDKLRSAVTNAQTTEVRFYIRTTVGGQRYFHYVTRTFTITNCNPVITDPVVKDITPETLALTGDENTVIRYESMVEYSFTATAMKQATIVNQSIQNGDKIITGLSNGVIDNIESNLFVFSVTDSRGLTTTATVEKNFVDYVKPTCYQKLTTELVGETGAKANLTVYGNYFNGSFGLTNNTLKIEVRHTQTDGTMGDWVDLSPLGYTYDGNTYELVTEVTGLDYSQAYTFQCRVTDKLNVVQSAQYVVRVLPVFDWDNDDFNFNVPINMDGETVLRHNAEAGNTVLSGTGGKIYLRPEGTNATYSETIFNQDGSVDFNGPIRVNGEEIGAGGGSSAPVAADYIIENGTESMGSNGTWYWEKWASGKAVCYGCRNYGKMATSTAVGNVYRSAMYQQDFPSGLFSGIPDVIHAHVNSRGTLWGGWVLLMSPTASSTGDFAVAHTSNVNLTASYVNFHVIGRWD